jgi:D-alanine-D-alanine ligase
VGTSIVREKGGWKEALTRALASDTEALIEEYISGVEVTCGVLEDEQGNTFALPPTEIILNSEFFDYEAKYIFGKSREITPARLDPELIKKVQRAASRAHSVLGCRGMSLSYGHDYPRGQRASFIGNKHYPGAYRNESFASSCCGSRHSIPYTPRNDGAERVV